MIGYVLCGEEHSPGDLVANAARAEQAGFRFAFVSDHFHPWNSNQGHSPFVWSLLGALSQRVEMELGTAVTCPLFRLHPAAVAQAAATTACLARGGFFLGVGTGENLNEHVVGHGWPDFPTRLAMLSEAIAIIRKLWSGREVDFEGDYFRLHRARLYDLPSSRPALMMAASGPRAAAQASQVADGLIALGPDPVVLEAFGSSKPRWAQLSVCWASTRKEAAATARSYWPEMCLEGTRFAELTTPSEFETACATISEQDLAAAVVCGPDPKDHRQAIDRLLEAGFDRVAVHQIGPDQAGFLDFYAREVL